MPDGGLAHPVSTSVFSMLKVSISPTVAPLTGRSSPIARITVSGTKITDSSQVGGSYIFCMISIAGITMWPTIRMVKYGGASSARARPSGA